MTVQLPAATSWSWLIKREVKANAHAAMKLATATVYSVLRERGICG